MKTDLSRHIQQIFSLLKRKTNFSFLNAGVIITIASMLFSMINQKSIMFHELKNGKLELNHTRTIGSDFSYIKPFTALVRFSQHALKDPESKIESSAAEQSTFQSSFPLTSLKPF